MLTDGEFQSEQIGSFFSFAKASDEFGVSLIGEARIPKDAWKDYFGDTAAGLKQQSALWSDAMRGIITEVSAAEDKESAFYQSLIRLSNEGVDVSGMLDQYGALGAMLLDGATSADELYAA